MVIGDFLVLDNASVHVANRIMDVLRAILGAYGVRIVLLPPYSPELNPCELVFGKVKNWLRNNRGRGPFINEIVRAFSHVSHQNVQFFYKKSLG